MSALITVKFHGDVDTFRKAAVERADELLEVSSRGRSLGCLSHRFGVGDGYIVAIDEWTSAEDFEKFFNVPEMREFIVRMGASTDVPPEVTVAEAIDTADRF